MNIASIAVEAQNQRRVQGFALVAVITALMLTLLLEALDQAIVGTAMPRIIAQLHGLDRYSWVVTVYILASMTMVPVVGKLSDQFGRKWFLLSGTLLFLVGSILAGASQSMNQLILFRGLQGLGAGIGMALVATVMADLFPPDERAKWMSAFGIVYGVSSLFGPTLGGWLAEHGPLMGSLVTEASRWRWVFYINLPVGLIAVMALLMFLPTHLSGNRNVRVSKASLRQIDFPGAALCAAATICLMLGLTWGGNQVSAGTSLQVYGMLVAGVVLFALFLFVESKAVEPILPLNLFRNSVFGVGASLALIQMMVLMGYSLYLPLFFQGVLAISPTNAGLVMTPFSMSMVFGAMLGSTLVSKLKRSQMILVLSALLMSVGALLITLMTPATNLLQAIVFMVLLGIGIGPFFSLPMVAVQNALPASQLGVSTASLRYLGQLGATLGIAVVGTVISSATSGSIMSHMPTSAVSRMALANALHHGFLAILVFALIALIATCFLKEGSNSPSQEMPSEEMVQADEEPEKELVGV